MKGILDRRDVPTPCSANGTSASRRTDNLRRVREDNTSVATSTHWARDVAKVLNRRFENPPAGRDRPLVELAIAVATETCGSRLLLFHMTRDEFLVA